MSREPVAIAGAVIAIIECVVVWALGREFLAEVDTTMILGVTVVAVPLAVSWLTRAYVTPVSDPEDNQGRKLVPSS